MEDRTGSHKAKKLPTMRDVGDLLGVSKQTVSAVINGKPGITPETTAQVRAAIEQLGYRPHHSARSLATGRTNMLALFVFDVSMPMPGQVAVAAEQCASAHGYQLVVYNTRDSLEREGAYVSTVLQRSVDGVIFMPAADASEGPQKLVEADVPVVTILRRPTHYEGPSVTLNSLKAGGLAARHLLELGHRNFVALGGPVSVHTGVERVKGFRDELATCPEATLCHLVQDLDWRPISAYRAMKDILAQQTDFTAVFAAGDALALGALRALHEAGLSVPQDVSLVGLDDNATAPFLTPPLTTVRMPVVAMAETCVRLLVEAIDGQAAGSQSIIVEPELVVRQSTAAPSAGMRRRFQAPA
jgi:LacI family transcriptional regulator